VLDDAFRRSVYFSGRVVAQDVWSSLTRPERSVMIALLSTCKSRTYLDNHVNPGLPDDVRVWALEDLPVVDFLDLPFVHRMGSIPVKCLSQRTGLQDSAAEAALLRAAGRRNGGVLRLYEEWDAERWWFHLPDMWAAHELNLEEVRP